MTKAVSSTIAADYGPFPRPIDKLDSTITTSEQATHAREHIL
jgi:hypothetical protein